MSERDPIELIKEQLNGVERMTALHPDHEVFKQWHTETKTILEKAFSSKSVHYQNFLALRFREVSLKTFASPEIDKINTVRFKKDLESVRNILQSAIKELTLDRTLFKKIQTTPKTVDFSLKGEYFVSSGIQEPEMMEAIKNAFEGSGLSPIFGIDTLHKGESIHHRIDLIRGAKFGIYDLSMSGNPDALIELGIALGLEKNVVLIYKRGFPYPQITKSLNRIKYENFLDLTEKLRKGIR